MITIGLLFWLIMLFVLMYWGFQSRGPEGKWNYWGFGGWAVLWILLALLGWKVYGAPIAGG